MVKFILNDQDVNTDLPPGTTVLDFVRYHEDLKGTKIGCREGDCGACTILVGELKDDKVSYRTMTSCLMPLANAQGKHIVTIEGINPDEHGSPTPVQQAMIDESGTQCGFCTVGFVMSLTGFCIDQTAKTAEGAVSAIDGNICRCTGYKSIERAALKLCDSFKLADAATDAVPQYFDQIPERLKHLSQPTAARLSADSRTPRFVGGGTDLYVQRPDQMVEERSRNLFYDDQLRFIRDAGEFIEIGASVTVTDLLESPVMQAIFPDLYKHLKLVSSTPIRNMATLAGNFVNASPIGDMTVWFLALDASIELTTSSNDLRASAGGETREIQLRDFYRGYKRLDKGDGEYITRVRFRKPTGDFHFNFEKVSKRTYLDIATVNTAISLNVVPVEQNDGPPVPSFILTEVEMPQFTIESAHVSAGGVAPVPLYLKETSAFLRGKGVTDRTISKAGEIMQSEISPISDVRGAADYKRLLLRQLFTAHFVELFSIDPPSIHHK
jgi:xanthine dehydrogenase small subunit